MSRCSKLNTTKLERKAGMETGKRNQSHRQIEILVFSFSLQPGMKLVCAQEYKVKTAQRAENTKVGRRRCRGKSDTRHKKIKKKKRRKERQGGTARAKRKRERERERKENKGGQGLKIK